MPLFMACVAIIVLVVGMLASGASNVEEQQQSTAASTVDRGLAIAEGYLKDNVQAQVLAANSTDIAVAAPPNMAPVPYCPSGGSQPECALGVQASFTVDGGTSVSAGGAQQVPNLQRNPDIDESIVTMKVLAQVVGAGSVVLAQRPETLTLRLTKVPGHEVTLAGGVNGVADSTGAADASRAGCDPTNTTTCDAAAPANQSFYDTRIHAQSICTDPGCLATPIPQDQLVSSSLGNGGAVSNGWRQ
jgi:hypothetical protein